MRGAERKPIVSLVEISGEVLVEDAVICEKTPEGLWLELGGVSADQIILV